MYHKDRLHVPCFAASVHFFRGHRQITDAHDWIVEQQDADHFQLATFHPKQQHSTTAAFLLQISKIEKSVSIDRTRPCIYTSKKN
tara:strand:+ start:572 stop:826 length:255 start_codon:yes stop_codon:yes gene_type:complete